MLTTLFFITTFLSSQLVLVLGGNLGQVICTDSSLDWYTRAVGETPCRTYERLRQTCNKNYVLRNITSDIISDTCDDPVGDCCCNNIAFSLRNLCSTCQGGGGREGLGFDYAQGTYQKYLNSSNGQVCQVQSYKSLPTTVQEGVCNQGIKIFQGMYNRTVWEEGSWFFRWTADFLTMQYSSLKDSAFHECTNTTSPQSLTSTSTTSSASPDKSNSKSSVSGGTVAAIVLAILLVIVAGAIGVWFYRRRKCMECKEERKQNAKTFHSSMMTGTTPVPPQTPQSFFFNPSPSPPRPRTDAQMFANGSHPTSQRQPEMRENFQPNVGHRRRRSDILDVDGEGTLSRW